MKQDLTFGMILGPPSVRKISAMLLQSIYSTFEGVCFFSWKKQISNKVFLPLKNVLSELTIFCFSAFGSEMDKHCQF